VTFICTPGWPPLPRNKINYSSACVREFCEIYAPKRGLRAWAFECCRSQFPTTDPHCHDNEIRDKIGYNSAYVKNICEIFLASVLDFSEISHQMLLTKFYPDRPLQQWQHNVKQNGLYLKLYNKYNQDPCIWRRWRLRDWHLDDVSRSLPQPTLISRYNEQQRSRRNRSSRYIQRFVPDRRYTALPLKR